MNTQEKIAALREAARYIRAAADGESDRYRTEIVEGEDDFDIREIVHPRGEETAANLDAIADELERLL